jgi:hypothetical protein
MTTYSARVANFVAICAPASAAVLRAIRRGEPTAFVCAASRGGPASVSM